MNATQLKRGTEVAKRLEKVAWAHGTLGERLEWMTQTASTTDRVAADRVQHEWRTSARRVSMGAMESAVLDGIRRIAPEDRVRVVRCLRGYVGDELARLEDEFDAIGTEYELTGGADMTEAERGERDDWQSELTALTGSVLISERAVAHGLTVRDWPGGFALVSEGEPWGGELLQAFVEAHGLVCVFVPNGTQEVRLPGPSHWAGKLQKGIKTVAQISGAAGLKPEVKGLVAGDTETEEEIQWRAMAVAARWSSPDEALQWVNRHVDEVRERVLRVVIDVELKDQSLPLSFVRDLLNLDHLSKEGRGAR